MRKLFLSLPLLIGPAFAGEGDFTDIDDNNNASSKGLHLVLRLTGGSPGATPSEMDTPPTYETVQPSTGNITPHLLPGDTSDEENDDHPLPPQDLSDQSDEESSSNVSTETLLTNPPVDSEDESEVLDTPQTATHTTPEAVESSHGALLREQDKLLLQLAAAQAETVSAQEKLLTERATLKTKTPAVHKRKPEGPLSRLGRHFEKGKF